MTVSNTNYCLEKLKGFNRTLDNSFISKKTTKQIEQFLTANQSHFLFNKELISELESLAIKVKREAPESTLIAKIRGCVQTLLPVDPEKLIFSFTQLRKSGAGIESISKWIELMDIPIDALELSDHDLLSLRYPHLQYQSPRIKLNGPLINSIGNDLKNSKSIRTDHENRIIEAIGRRCALVDAQETALNIHKFAIQNEAALIDILKLCLKGNDLTTLQYIRKSGTKDPKEFDEIDNFYTKMTCKAILRNIQNYGIKDQTAIFEIAKICALKDSTGTPAFIHNFGIQDEALIAEIAKICAQGDSKQTAKFIKNFRLQNQENVIQIAMIISKSDDGIAKFIQNFEGLDENIRIDLAKTSAHYAPRATAKYIKNFCFTNPDTLVEIAKICAKGYGDFWKYIKNFPIENEKNRIALIKIGAKNYPLETAKRFKKYGLINEKNKVKLVQFFARQDVRATALHFNQYDIKNSNEIVKIVKFCAERNPFETATHIQKFGIKDEKSLIKIAKICARTNGWATAELIRNFQIKSQKALIDIATICAQNHPSGTAENIKKFNILDENEEFEVSMICGKKHGAATARLVNHFNIKNDENRLKLFITCVMQNENAINFMKNFNLIPETNENKEKSSDRQLFFNVIDLLIHRIQGSPDNLAIIQDLEKNISLLNPPQQPLQARWLLRTLCFLTNLDQTTVNWLLNTGLIQSLSMLHDPILKLQLTEGLFKFVDNQEQIKRWEPFLSSKENKKGMKLLLIPFFKLELAGIDHQDVMATIKKIHKLQFSNDAVKIQKILQLTHLLDSTEILTPIQKAIAFKKIFIDTSDDRQVLDNVVHAKTLLQIKQTEWVNSKENLKYIVKNHLEMIIPLKGVQDDPVVKFDQYFASSRNPEGLLIYAAGLKTLNEPELLNCLGQFVVSVFNGTFHQNRYDVTDNLHLAKIFRSRPDLTEKWKNASTVKLLQPSNGSPKQEVIFDAKDWLTTKLMKDHHLGEEDLTYVQEYLNAKEEREQSDVRQKLTEQLRVLAKSKKKIELDQDPRALNLKLQLACIKLAAESIDEVENNLKVIDQSLRLKKSGSEFANDIKAIRERLTQIKAKQVDQEKLQAVITDDPIDLLLAGTDVSGSCQRLDGSPEKTKGLLGYIIDGKNQMIAIKNANGKILARTMLSILWDGEKPVLFRERFYPDTISMNEKRALNALALQLATELQLSITTGDEKGTLYNKDLFALGGPAPYEYSDAAGGMQQNGIYTITEAKLLNK